MNGMDLNFTLGNLITILVIIVPAIIGYANLKSESKTNRKDLNSLEDKQKEDLLHVQNGKRAIKKDLIVMIEKEAQMVKNRIDKTQERIEDDKKQNQIEFKEINKVLNQILGYVKKD